MENNNDHSHEQNAKLQLKATLNSKGQVTIPIKLRKQLNMNTGDTILFKETNDNELILKVEKKYSLLSVIGALPVKRESNKPWEDIIQETRDEMAEKISKEGKN
ncbi:AbrB/MazE/SpoVT family DNA-binding domain-containing protein [Salipaludibacillus sp. CF4.18]|uniref:AbrB/MazE/SpoVT family DNA-binding domain-containing protein n=1 Tax=Salipaludibacillus sp. CF4.18 TaxID=3373081 RepID=UPI003EE68109